MTNTTNGGFGDLFSRPDEVTRLIKKAMRNAVLEHKLAGNPVACSQDGKVVWIPAEEIVVPEEDEE